MKIVPVAVLVSCVLFAGSAFSSGLGDTVKDIRAQHGSKVRFDDTYYVFGKPPRVARLDVNSMKFFGEQPTQPEFAKKVRVLLPSDSKPLQAFAKSRPTKKEIYTFSSSWMARLPSIKDGVLDSPPDTLTIYANYDGDKVISFVVSMGLPGEVDLSGAKKLPKNPFK